MTSHVIAPHSSDPHAYLGIDQSRVVHLLVPMAADIERFGISVCGYPAEYLDVVRDLSWADVEADRRCPHCDAPAAASQPA